MRHFKYIKDYRVVAIHEVSDYSGKGYVPVGGVAFNGNGSPCQAMALYEDTLFEEKKDD